MQNAEITIEDLGTVAGNSAATVAVQKAIYVENEHSESVYCITLRGTCERKYYFVTELSVLHEDRVLLDGDLLIVCLLSDIILIDLQADKVRKVVNVTSDPDMCAIYKFKGGYFVHGEMTNRYFDSDFNLLWGASGRDIFFCPDRKNSLEIYDDHIDVWDFLGNKYTYDELGEINSFWRNKLKKYY